MKRKEILIVFLLTIFSLVFSLEIKENGLKIVINYNDRIIVNSSSPFEINGTFSIFNESSKERIIVNGATIEVDENLPLSISLIEKNATNESFRIKLQTSNTPLGFYDIKFNLTINYTVQNQSNITNIPLSTKIEVNSIIISIKVFPTQLCIPFYYKNSMCANIENYIIVMVNIFPSNISKGININVTGFYDCEDLRSNRTTIIYIPKKPGICEISLEASKFIDSYFFYNSTSEEFDIIPYFPKEKPKDFNISYQNLTFKINENENVTFTYFISVQIPQKISVEIENISLDKVVFENELEIEKNITKNITFFNLEEGTYLVNIKFTSNYSIEKNLTIKIFVERFINISYYLSEIERIVNILKEKNLESDSEMIEKINALNSTFQNITTFKNREYEEKFDRIKKEIEILITQKEVKESAPLQETQKEQKREELLKPFPIFLIIIPIVAIMILIFFVFRKKRSYFDLKRKKFVPSKEDMEVWKKLKEKWERK
jgi:hypothetical protein